MKISKTSVMLIKQGNNEEFKKFYLQNVDFFFRWLKANYQIDNEDAKDILSDFFLKLWNNKDKIPTNGYKNRIWTVFRNTVKDRFKRKKIIGFSIINNTSEISLEEKITSEESIENIIDQNFKLEKIKEALKKLDNIYQDVIFLKFIENKTNGEISEILNISEETVRQRISRGIKKLIKLIK